MPDLRLLASSTHGCLGVVRSRSGSGIRVKCEDFARVKKSLVPDWVPQEHTPYGAPLPLRLNLHHVHPAAGKTELQTLLNAIPWKAMVIRQLRPGQWIVAAETPPDRDTILTQHGCILILPANMEPVLTPSKGKGKGKKGKGIPRSFAGGMPVMQAASHTSPLQGFVATGQFDHKGPIQQAFTELEDKMEKRLSTMKQEAAASHAILEKDITSTRDEFRQHVANQEVENKKLHDEVAGGGKCLREPAYPIHGLPQSDTCQTELRHSGSTPRRSGDPLIGAH